MSSFRRLILLLGVLGSAVAADWPQYRGPNHDGSSPERIRTNWVSNPPKQIWRKAIGPGWSSMAVAGGKVYTQVRRAATTGGDREFCVALDAATGNEVWATEVGSANYTDLAGYSDLIDGPRSTPTVEGDRVYVLTSFLRLFCLRADNGVEIWRRDFIQEFNAQPIAWESAGSPVLVGDLIYLNSNAPGQRLMAIRKSNGTTAWGKYDFGMTHASPVYATIAGVPQVIFLTRSSSLANSGLFAVDPITGDILWKLNFSASATSTASSPAVSGEYVHASSAYAGGTWVARVTEAGGVFSATQAWPRQQGNAYQLHWATPIVYEGLIFTVPTPSSFQGLLACYDPNVGTNRWTRAQVGSGPIGYGSLIRAADTLIVLTESGELVTVQPNIGSYVETARFKVLSEYCWNHPALSNGRLYVRNSAINSEIVALDVRLLPPELPPFGIVAEFSEDHKKIRISAYSHAGMLMLESQTERVEVVVSSDLLAPASSWTSIGGVFTYADGALHVEVLIEAVAQKFLRVHDKEAQ